MADPDDDKDEKKKPAGWFDRTRRFLLGDDRPPPPPPNPFYEILGVNYQSIGALIREQWELAGHDYARVLRSPAVQQALLRDDTDPQWRLAILKALTDLAFREGILSEPPPDPTDIERQRPARASPNVAVGSDALGLAELPADLLLRVLQEVG